MIKHSKPTIVEEKKLIKIIDQILKCRILIRRSIYFVEKFEQRSL
jgi:hypothetical protein